MAKMYYTEEETSVKLGVAVSELADYVRDQKLRLFKDGERNMYMSTEVDALAPESDQEQVELAPAADTATLSQADQPPKPAGKEDTVITADGISIFDDEDLEIEAADPMAKTQIAPSIEDQISIEGVGSGSGLLDLTRESDDTSLGAVIDHIDLEGPIDDDEPSAPVGTYGAPVAAAPEPSVVVVAAEPAEFIDASSGMFGGFLVGCALVALLLGAVTLAVATNVVPEYLLALKDNLTGLMIGAAVLVMVFGGIGMFIGKAIAAQKAARQAAA